MVYLFAKLKKHANEVQKTPNPSTDRYIAALNHGFAKFSEYYTKVDEPPYYTAAVSLHPCSRFTCTDDNWTSTTGGGRAILNAKQSIRHLFDDHLTRAIAE
jgi:hypothetical protein